MDKDTARQKKEVLISNLKDLGSLVVAFSGGVDSSFLLAVAHDVLKEKVMASTARSVIHTSRETEDALEFTRGRGIRHVVFKSIEMEIPDFVRNGPDRCYYCKRQLVETLLDIARREGIAHVAHGANLDDVSDYRPGFRAAQEAGVISPLIAARLNKEEIRYLSRESGLSTWDRPAMACLASRIPYGSKITEEKLRMADEAEIFLLEHGLKDVRVRHHGSVARIETGIEEFENLMEAHLRGEIVERFRKIGFLHISMDLEGYVPGKLNRDLGKQVEIL
jgi:pyridinium-3,5-biscarboxylic acid mononucleotide sulfurtransferase